MNTVFKLHLLIEYNNKKTVKYIIKHYNKSYLDMPRL